jgi:hypothetical protein
MPANEPKKAQNALSSLPKFLCKEYIGFCDNFALFFEQAYRIILRNVSFL